MEKRNKIIYWIFTVWLCLGLVSTGIVQVIGLKEETAMILALGYPPYVVTLLGFTKLLAAIALLIPRFPLLKEWAYAGLFFDLFGAVYSGIAVAKAVDPMMAFMLVWFVPGILSYIFWKKKMKYGMEVQK